MTQVSVISGLCTVHSEALNSADDVSQVYLHGEALNSADDVSQVYLHNEALNSADDVSQVYLHGEALNSADDAHIHSFSGSCNINLLNTEIIPPAMRQPNKHELEHELNAETVVGRTEHVDMVTLCKQTNKQTKSSQIKMSNFTFV